MTDQPLTLDDIVHSPNCHYPSDGRCRCWETVPQPTKQRPGDQPLPTTNSEPFVQDRLKDFIERRKQVGIDRYGTALQPHNGRDALLDAFEEAVDLSIYLAQVLIERDGQLPGEEADA